MDNKYKLVYKKPTLYDNDTLSANSVNLENNLDDSVESNYSDNSDTNNNDLLRKNIIDDINIKKINSEEINIEETNIKKINIEETNIEETNIEETNTNNIKNHVKIFLIYLKKKNINFEELNNNTTFNKLVKNFVLEYKLNQQEIILLVTQIKKLSNFLKNKKDVIEDTNTENINDKNSNLSESDLSETININSENNYLLNKLSKNDINTWIFMGVIIISIIILIMIIIYKK